MKFSPITSISRSEVREALLDYYDRCARDLPWRRDTDPYRVLVSEVMLQQTRVDTVKGYYVRWLDQFPSIDSLAAAEEDEVLKAWEGLGYYRRARNLRRAAVVVRERYGGALPSTSAELRELPGVGEYTAGAVASIAFGRRAAAVDGNVRRVFARLFDVATPTPAWLREKATALVDEARPGDWNQGLMELGATVCTPRSPSCQVCPLERWCAARAAGTQLERPTGKLRKEVPTAQCVLAVLHTERQVLLVKRPPDGLLGGMWAFPEQRLDAEADLSTSGIVARSIAEMLGLHCLGVGYRLRDCRHRFTHLEAEYIPWSIEVAGEASVGAYPATAIEWAEIGDTNERALPVAQRKVLESWLNRPAREAV